MRLLLVVLLVVVLVVGLGLGIVSFTANNREIGIEEVRSRTYSDGYRNYSLGVFSEPPEKYGGFRAISIIGIVNRKYKVGGSNFVDITTQKNDHLSRVKIDFSDDNFLVHGKTSQESEGYRYDTFKFVTVKDVLAGVKPEQVVKVVVFLESDKSLIPINCTGICANRVRELEKYGKSNSVFFYENIGANDGYVLGIPAYIDQN